VTVYDFRLFVVNPKCYPSLVRHVKIGEEGMEPQEAQETALILALLVLLVVPAPFSRDSDEAASVIIPAQQVKG